MLSTIDAQTELNLIQRIKDGVIKDTYKNDRDVLISPGFSPVTLLSIRKMAQYAGLKRLFFYAGGEKWRRLL